MKLGVGSRSIQVESTQIAWDAGRIVWPTVPSAVMTGCSLTAHKHRGVGFGDEADAIENEINDDQRAEAVLAADADRLIEWPTESL